MKKLISLALALPSLAMAGLIIEDGALTKLRPAPQHARGTSADAAPSNALQPASAPVSMPSWTVHDGDRVRSTIERWAADAGWSVLWRPSDLDYIAEAGATFQGDFPTAIRMLFDSIPFEGLAPKDRVRVNVNSENKPPLVTVMRDDGPRK